MRTEKAVTTTETDTLHFASEKSKLFAWIFWGTIVITAGSAALPLYEYFARAQIVGLLIIGVVCLALAAMLAWAWFNTNYTISDDKIFWRSGILHGSIDIHTIKHITKNDTLMSGLRPALAQKGLIIQYADWKEIYISPVKKDEFVDILLQINPQIEVNEITINFNKY